MRSSAAARRYARALFSLARDGDRIADVQGELARMSEMLDESRALADALLTPLHPVKERKGVLAAITKQAGMSGEVQHFFSFLIDQRRLVDFPAIRDEYGRLADEASGLRKASVIAASPLGAEREEKLRRVLSERTGSEIQLEVSVDPELIGGAIAKVGDLVYDGSLRTQLRQLRANLTK